MVETKFILTGSSGGLGKTLIPKLASLGSLDALYDKNSPVLSGKGNVNLLKLDLLDSFAIEEYVDSLKTDTNLNIVFVHAATLNMDDLIVNLDIDKIVKIFTVNLFSAMNFAKTLIPVMMANGTGQFIFLSSVVPKMSLPGTSAYSSSKVALEQFSRSLVTEYGRFGIRSNVIRLGYFETGLIRILTDINSKKILSRVPSNKFGKTENLDNAIDFILRSDYFNGSILDLNGGIN
jgi:NAD(P)-dependent dehydrogenase (short-subunit alcohol dehydrogenase family)